MQKTSLSSLVPGWILACILSLSAWGQDPTKRTFSGYVLEAGSNEALVGASVYAPYLKMGTVTNGFGYFALQIPSDTCTIWIRYVGYSMEVRHIQPGLQTAETIHLKPGKNLDEITIVGQVDTMPNTVDQVQMSLLSIKPSAVKAIPALLGEKDVVKVLQLLPGVQKGSEGSAGLYVRGGGPDQNLILLDDAPVYNAFHLFGFFSLFNGDALKTIELTKGGFPARFGGRLSSVLEMRMKEGNQQKWKGEGSVGLIASRLTIEGPIWKNKSSFLVSGRRSYLDILSAPFQPSDSKARFFLYDLNVKLNHSFSDRDKVYLSGYFGRDLFGFRQSQPAFGEKDEAGLYWGNATGTFRWNHVIHPKLFANLSLIYSRYRFNIYNKTIRPGSEFNLSYYSGIEDFSLKADFDYFYSEIHQFKFGLQTIRHNFTPSAFVLKDTDLNENRKEATRYISYESGLYLEDLIKISNRTSLNVGLRQTSFLTEGKNRFRLEPRISGRFKIRDDLSLKASFADMNQFIHLLSNTGIGLPTDLWIPSSPKVSPQRSQQVAFGMARDLAKYDLTVSLEGYFKQMHQIIQYKEGASFLELDAASTGGKKYSWENQIVRGKGKSFGMEALIQRHVGKFTGWLGYTLSWTTLQFPDLNGGKPFFARYDRRHDVSVVGMYKIREGLSVSATWVYGTGNAITLPLASYHLPDHKPAGSSQNGFLSTYHNAMEYSERNGYRMAAYHRLDLSIQWHKKKKWGERSWELSVYNAYNRKNPFFYYIGSRTDAQGNTVNTLKQITLFPIIPSLSYHFTF